MKNLDNKNMICWILGAIVIGYLVWNIWNNYENNPSVEGFLAPQNCSTYSNLKDCDTQNCSWNDNDNKCVKASQGGHNSPSLESSSKQLSGPPDEVKSFPNLSGLDMSASYASVNNLGGLTSTQNKQLFIPNNNYPADCFPRDKLSSKDLLPTNTNNQWGNLIPELSDKNFLDGGASIGINTVGTCIRNGNQQIRSEPPNPQVIVSPWMQSTIEPDMMQRPLEIGINL